MPKIVHDEEVFQAVMRVMMERGYSGATTKELAAAAGISEMTLFRKYGSKVGLVKLAFNAIADQVDFDSATEYSGDVKADLLGIVERYRSLAQGYGPFLFQLMPEAARHPELTEALQRPMRVMGDIAQLIARYQAEGVLHEEPPFHSTAILLGPLMYIEMLNGRIVKEGLPTMDIENYVLRFLNGRLRE